MATVFLSPIGNGAQLFDDNGVPLNGGFVNTYAAGTTTPTATYTTAAGNIANANPIALNSAGRITTEVWIPQGIAVKFVPVSSVSQAVGTQLDNIYGINDPTTANGIGYTGATVSGALIMNAAPINEAQGANISVASAINLTTATGNYLSLTGSGTITAIQLSQGAYRELVVNTVSAAFVNSNTMALLGGASFTPAVGDILGFRGEAAPVVRQVLYQKASGVGNVVAVTVSGTLAAGVNLTNSTAYFDGPTVSVGPVGTWLVQGHVIATDASQGSSVFVGRLSDGATTQDAVVGTQYATSALTELTMFGVFSNPAGNIRISVLNASSNAGQITSNAARGAKDSIVIAVRIA